MKKKMSIVITLVLMVSMFQGSLFANNHRMLRTESSNTKDRVIESGGAERLPLNYVANAQGMKSFGKKRTRGTQDIVDIAVADGRFQTLVAALQAADLVDTLKGNGPFTVFAPTDDAFAKLPAGTIDELLKPENKDMLVNILTYHVIGDQVLAEDVVKLDGKEVTMLNGDKAKIEVRNGKVYIDGAQVIVTDIMARNGVIHVIDTVMMPPTD